MKWERIDTVGLTILVIVILITPIYIISYRMFLSKDEDTYDIQILLSNPNSSSDGRYTNFTASIFNKGEDSVKLNPSFWAQVNVTEELSFSSSTHKLSGNTPINLKPDKSITYSFSIEFKSNESESYSFDLQFIFGHNKGNDDASSKWSSSNIITLTYNRDIYQVWLKDW